MTELTVSVTNVGGIETHEVTVTPGTSVVSGVNASNKTSLLKAVAFGLGADDVPLRSGTDRAEVSLTLEGTTVTRTATKKGTGLSISGDPWLEDRETRRKFETVAALLEFNPIRTAVRQGENVGEVLKGPVDFDRLEQERADLLNERRDVRRTLEDLADVDERLETTESELAEARERQEDLKAQLSELEAAYEPQAEDERLSELRERRTELRNEKQLTADRIESIRSAIDRMESENSDLDSRIDDIEASLEDADSEDIQTKRQELRSELDEVVERLDLLQSAMTANRELLQSEYAGVLGSDHELSGDKVRCWNCGDMADVSAIEDTLGELSDLVQREKRRKREYEPEIQELSNQLSNIREERSTLQELQNRRRELEMNLEDRRSSLETVRSRREELDSEIEELSSEIDTIKQEQSSDTSEIADNIEQTRVEIETVKREIKRLEDRSESLRSKVEERERLRERDDRLGDSIQEITERIEGMEERLREQFNDAMDDLLTSLAFEELERVWLDGDFELIVAREIDGSVTRDTVSNLAEGERELVGLVLGLAGYLAYDLSGEVPVILLDSLGALDVERVDSLVQYFDDKSTYVIAAAHPETATAVEGEEIQVLRAPRAD